MTSSTEEATFLLVWPKYGTDLELDMLQGFWTENQYLKISEQMNHLIEYTDGMIETQPMPTRKHQAIIFFLMLNLRAAVQSLGGAAFFAPLRLQLRPGKYREPDLLVLLDARDPRNQNAFWLGADLVMEVVSPDKPERDLVTKRADYAEAGIPEYWIVNPIDETIMVLTLADGVYAEHGSFKRGEQAHSRLLNGLAVSVDEVFDAE